MAGAALDPVVGLIVKENGILLSVEVEGPAAFLPWLQGVLDNVGLAAEPAHHAKAEEGTLHVLVFASGTGEALLYEAERCGLLKPGSHRRYATAPLQPLTTSARSLASVAAAHSTDLHRLHEALSPEVLAADPTDPAVRCMRHVLSRVLTPGDIVMLTSQLLDDAVAEVEDIGAILGRTPAQVLDLHVGGVPTSNGDLVRALPVLQAAGAVTELTALHVKRHALGAWWAIASPWNWLDMSGGVTAMREYLGDSTGLYFAWVQFSLTWFLLPGGVALALFLHRPSTMTVDTSPYVPLYSLLVVPLWAIVFVRMWHQRAAAYATAWGSLPDLQDSARRFEAGASSHRPQFTGTLAISAVTGMPAMTYPTRRRALAYALSVAVTGVMLAGVLVILVAFLNLEGYLHDPASPLHVPFLFDLARPGAVFDPNQASFLPPLVPVVLHVGVVLFINQALYARVAEWLTANENHPTEDAHEMALATKRFVFEACDCYLAMFFLAFGARDILLLRSELVSVYSTDSIRRVLVEAVLPLAQMWLTLGRLPGLCPRRSKKGKGGEKAAATAAGEEEDDWSIAAQLGRSENEGNFDDLLELAIQLGYVTLFAAAFPLASLLSVGTTWLEARSDAFKYAFALQRPIPRREADLGVWEGVLVSQAWLAVLTNVLLFGLSSDQLAILMPEWFEHTGTLTRRGVTSHVYEFRAGEGRDAVAALWGLEHLVLGLALVLWLLLPAQGQGVQDAIARRHYVEGLAVREEDLGVMQSQEDLPVEVQGWLGDAGSLAARLAIRRGELDRPVKSAKEEMD